jgi:hypothetical protein
MKKVYVLCLSLLVIGLSTKAQTMQGTIKPGNTPRTIDVYLKPSSSFSQKDEAMTFVLAIPATVSPAPKMGSSGVTANGTGAVTTITGLQPTFLIDNIGSTSREVVVSTQTINSSSYYIYTFIFAGTAAANHNWTAGTEQQIFSIQFNGCTTNCNPNNELLVNLPNGGSQGNSYWYFQPNTLGDITNYAAPFYANPQSTTSTNGGSSDGSALSLIGLATPVSLPIKLASFNATTNNCNANLSWQTAEQSIGASYSIERSEDQINFKEVGRVVISTTNFYSFTDKTASSGTSYYRLKLLDLDGKTVYSSIKEVNINCSGLERVLVYPTLTNEVVNIKLSAEYQNSKIRVINISGEEVASDFSKTTNRSISLKGLANGTYIVQIIGNGKNTDNFKVNLQK